MGSEKKDVKLIIKERVKDVLDSLPYVSRLSREVRRLSEENRHLKEIYRTEFPPGHYYSPIPSRDELIREGERIFSEKLELAALDINRESQFKLLEELRKYYDQIPFTPQKIDELRYCYDNDYFEYSDAIFLYCMMRYAQPKKIIEVGSGYSSAVMLDTDQLFLNSSIEFTFIEPYPSERLNGLLTENDRLRCRIIESPLQNVGLELFFSLQENDILFIDSTHVSKAGSDVNYALFEILPRLQKGVIVHLHDIFYPFEYPKTWLIDWLKGFAWNEAYLLRAFLMYNDAFKVMCFNSYLEAEFESWMRNEMPLCMKKNRHGNSGQSIWLVKVK